LTHVFSEFYLASKANAQSCDFAGNATIQSSTPTDTTAIQSQISSCFSAQPSVFTPSPPTNTPIAGSNTGATTTATNSSNNNGVASLLSRGQAAAIMVTGLLGVLGAILVL